MVTELHQQCERKLIYEDNHLYDGQCGKCGNPAILRGYRGPWFHTTVTWCKADQDVKTSWFILNERPLSNCYCEECSHRR